MNITEDKLSESNQKLAEKTAFGDASFQKYQHYKAKCLELSDNSSQISTYVTEG